METDITQPPLDPLTERELGILRHVADGLTDREIAQELFLSVNTIKWHNKQIYRKLDVGSRYQAVAKAKEFGLLDPQPDLSADQRPESKHNLPAPVTSFIGRERELTEVKRLLETARLVTLTGPGGIGKTRLALEAASQQIQTFTDGVTFVPLAPLRSIEAIVPTLAKSLDLSFFDAEDPKTRLLAYFRDKHILLVLDNLEHLLDGASLFSEVLQAAPRVKIIATSREKLNLLGETAFSTPGLDFPGLEVVEDALEYSSVNLFVQSAKRARSDFEPSLDDVRDIARICQLVQGMPLALVLAAAWVSTLTCRDIAAEIERGLDILEVELRDLPERQRSIRAVFDHSWNLTPAEERGVYERLSVFRGGFTREAAEYVTGASLKSLSALVDKSLIWLDASGRYEIHELLRQYAEENLINTPGAQEQTSALHCAYYAEFMYQREKDLIEREMGTHEEIEKEIGNVRASWSWAIMQGNLEALDRQRKSLFQFYETRSWYQEGLDSFARAVEAIAPASHIEEEEAVLAGLLLHQSYFSTRLGDYGNSIVLLQKSVGLLRELGDRDELADALTVLAATEFYLGNYEDADRLLRECLLIREESGKLWELAWTSYWLGRVNNAQSKYEEAEHILQDVIAIHGQIGERLDRADAQIVLGLVMSKRGNYEEAIRLQEEALATAMELGNPHRAAWALLGLGKVELARDEFQQARSHFHEALQIALDMPSVRLTLDSLAGIGELLVHEEEVERAVELLSLIYNHPSSEHETRLQAEHLLGELGFELGSDVSKADAAGRAIALDIAIESVYALPQFSRLRTGKERSR